LIEILIVIALTSVLTGLVAFNIESIIGSFESVSIEEKFRKSVREARIAAAQESRPVYLRYDRAKEEFEVIRGLSADEGASEFTHGSYAFLDPEVEVTFYPIGATDQDGREPLSASLEVEPVPFLTFHPSGSSTPAEIHFRWRDGGQSTLTLDPFSSGPLASKELFQ